MRLAIISPFPPPEDGVGEYTRTLATLIAESGAAVEVWAPKPSGKASEASLGLATIRRGKLNLKTIQAWQSDFEPQLVIFQYTFAAYGFSVFRLFGALAGVSAKIPIVGDLHESVRDIKALGPVGRWIYRSLTSTCRAVIVHSEEALELVTTIRDGVDVVKLELLANEPTKRMNSGLAKPEPVGVLMAGFISKNKGADLAIKAFTKCPDLRERLLTIQGIPRRRKGVFKLFQIFDTIHYLRLRLLAFGHKNIRFVGYLSNLQFQDLVSRSTCLLLPYRSITQSGIQSMAAALGKHCLVSSLPGLGSLRGVTVVNTKSHETLSRDILSALNKVSAARAPTTNNNQLILNALSKSLARWVKDEG